MPVCVPQRRPERIATPLIIDHHDLRAALSRLTSIPKPAREYGSDELALLINLVCDEVDQLRTCIATLEDRNKRCAANGGMRCPLGECHPPDEPSTAN